VEAAILDRVAWLDFDRDVGVEAIVGVDDDPKRCSFLVGADQRIHGAWRYDDDQLPDIDDTLRASARMRAGRRIDE
jgi:hypothetical protein